MNILISGHINLETTVKIRSFPIEYYPIDYPFFGVNTDVSGVGYNIARALVTLGNTAHVISYIGKDEDGARILRTMERDGIGTGRIRRELAESCASVILYDNEGRRKIYCDLKDIQEKRLVPDEDTAALLASADIAVICNISFNRRLLEQARAQGVLIATDVHVLADIHDEYNRDFMKHADILFLSDEALPCPAEDFLQKLKDVYPCKIIVIGRGRQGAMLYQRENDEICALEAVTAFEVVSTVGAGDALFSAFLNYYGKGYPAREALKRAQVFAALKIRASGASAGFCSEAEVEKYL